MDERTHISLIIIQKSENSPVGIQTDINEREISETEKNKEKKEKHGLKVSSIPEKKEFKHLSKKNKERVNQAVDIAKINGKKAGKILNEMEDSEVRQVGVKEILDTYYSAETVDEAAVKEFSEILEEDIQPEIAAYTEAREERDNQENCDYVVGEELVIFDKDTTKEEIDKVISYISDSYEIILDNDFVVDESLSERKKERLKALETYKGNIVVKVNLDLDQTVEGAKEEFQKYECVENAGKNEILEVDTIQDEIAEEYASDQWYLTRAKFGIAWDTEATAGRNDVSLAVLDTGCRMTHEDFESGLIIKHSVDVTKTDSNGNYIKLSNLSKQYDSSHGTKCTGIMAAEVNNGLGIAGAARGWYNAACRVMSIKVSDGLRADGSENLTAANIGKGIDYAINAGAEVISISISGTNADAYKEYINRAEEAGVIVVASAGNENNTGKRYPAALDYVIAVGGTNKKDKKYSASSYGDWVDIAAPAVDYVSTSTDSDTDYDTGLNGTSFATPLVAAAIGEMLAVNPDLSVDQIKSFLFGTASATESSILTCKMLNAGLAVQRAKYEKFKDSTLSLISTTALSGNKIKVKWDDTNVYGTEQIIIYRATGKNGTYTAIKTLSADDIVSGVYSYTDSGLTAGKTYYYKARASMKYSSGYRYTAYSEIKSATAQK